MNTGILTKRKLILALVIVVAAAAGTGVAVFTLREASYSRRSDTTAESTLSRVKRTGKLNVGYVLYPPFVAQDANTGNVSGLFVDILSRIAISSGFELNLEEATLSTMIAGLQTDQFDLVPAIFSSIPRAKEVAFTESVVYVGTSAIVRRGESRVHTLADLTKPGLTIAVNAGGVLQDFAKEHLPNSNVLLLKSGDLSKPMLEVISGNADVALCDSAGCAKFALAHPEVTDLFAQNPYLVFGCAFVVRQGDYDWLNFLNIAIQRLELDGTISSLDEKYRKVNPSAWFLKTKPYLANPTRP